MRENSSRFSRTDTVRDMRHGLPKVLIPIAVVTASALFALTGPSSWLALLLVALPVVAVGSVVLIRQPGLGPILLVLAGLALPISLGTGTNTEINPVIVLVPALIALWVLDMALRERSIRVHPHAAVKWLLLFCAIAVLSFVTGQLPWFNLPGASFASQAGGLAVFFVSAMAFLLGAHVLNERWLERLVYVFISIVAVYMLGRLLPFAGLIRALFDSGADGSVFWVWAVALPVALVLFNPGLGPVARLVLVGITGLTFLVAFAQASVWASGWAPPLLALFLLLWLRFPRWGWLLMLVAAGLFLSQAPALWNVATDDQSWWARRQAWQLVLNAAMVNPLLGLGPSNYYNYVQQYDIGGWGGVWNVRFNSHNNFVDIIAQTGLLGMAVFIGFVAVMAKVGWKLYRGLPYGFARAFAAACLAGLIATLTSGMLGDWFLPFVYNVGLDGMRSSTLLWLFLGGLLSLYYAYGFDGRDTNSKG